MCVKKEYRNMHIGYKLLKTVIDEYMNNNDNDVEYIEFDCLLHNVKAKNLYHSSGFKEMYTGIGFNGTENTTEPEIVFFKRKTGDSLLG